ncbi:MAG TPA: hypothetical protein VIJ83_01495, partial [Solirubrobacteraceae bacterium]
MCSDSTHTTGEGAYAADAEQHEGPCRDIGMLRMAMSHHGPGRHGGGGPGHGRGRHRHRGFGGGEGGFGGFGGFGGGFGPGGGGPRGRGRKARRGDIRTAALLLLAEEPRNGYQI